MNTLLRLPLKKTNASPFFTDSTVINFNSLTRIPVPQMVCKIRLRRLLPLLSAADNSRLYSSLVSSFSSEQKICRCYLMVFIFKYSHPAKIKKLLIDAIIELILRTAYSSDSKCSLYLIANSFGYSLSSCILPECLNITQILFDSVFAFFLKPQIVPEFIYSFFCYNQLVHNDSLQSYMCIVFNSNAYSILYIALNRININETVRKPIKRT